MTEFFDYFVCKEEYKDGTYKLYPCYAPFMSFIEVGDIVTIEIPVASFLFAEGCVQESNHCNKIKKHDLKVIECGGTLTLKENTKFALVPFGRIIYKYNDVTRG